MKDARTGEASPDAPRSTPQEKYDLVGIGGAGMSVVAELMSSSCAAVSGSDSKESQTTRRLAAEGISVSIGHDARHVPADAVLVVSSAIREGNPELAAARERSQKILHRSQALALAARGRDFVAVAGAHGKTTTSAMIATALREVGLDPSWAIGGSVVGAGGGSHLGGGRAFVAEADESDASFLNYEPLVEVVTNVEPDHLDHYGSTEAFEEAFAQFARLLKADGALVACADSPGALRMAVGAIDRGQRVVTYGRGDGPRGAAAHVKVAPVQAQSGQARQEKAESGEAEHGRSKPGEAGTGESAREASRPLGASGTFDDGSGPVRVDLSVVGEHNLLNAAAAWAAGVELGVGREEMASALSRFLGTGRRFELRGEAGGVRVVDDYAHHPTEVEATLRAARAVVGDGALRVLFQPHLYSRTANFADRFAEALSLADDVVVTAVYAAREDPTPGVEGDLVTSKMDPARAQFVPDRFEAARALAARARPGDLVMTVGAGDVTELGPTILDQIGQR